jgi:hypothetical protein
MPRKTQGTRFVIFYGRLTVEEGFQGEARVQGLTERGSVTSF